MQNKVCRSTYKYNYLTPAQQNYNIEERELLEVKLALEEWRHWLEGAAHPFLVLMHHKNLEYLKTAKRFNSCQVWWALFFLHVFNSHLPITPVPGTPKQTP